LWPVKIDPAQVDQILANLTVNARDAMDGGNGRRGRITLKTANVEMSGAFEERQADVTPGQYVVLSVSDNGVGMDRETQARAFEPFFTTKLQGLGTGLGLATVYGIVKQNDGYIYIYSQPGEGTTIRVYLPRVVGSEAERVAEGEKPEPSGGTETILVVEDDQAVLRVVKRILVGLGYDVLAADSPQGALVLVRERGDTIDLLITDVVMPDMNGRELSEKVLALKPDMKCLFVSGYTRDVIASRGVLEEGMHFLEKPFSVEGLDTAVRHALGGSRT
jgi:CheY-like chemotaxis protein